MSDAHRSHHVKALHAGSGRSKLPEILEGLPQFFSTEAPADPLRKNRSAPRLDTRRIHAPWLVTEAEANAKANLVLKFYAKALTEQSDVGSVLAQSPRHSRLTTFVLLRYAMRWVVGATLVTQLAYFVTGVTILHPVVAVVLLLIAGGFAWMSVAMEKEFRS